jgi:hypothetical protein
MKAQKHNKMIRNNKDLSDLYIIEKCTCGSKDIDVNTVEKPRNGRPLRKSYITCSNCFRTIESVSRNDAIIEWNKIEFKRF